MCVGLRVWVNGDMGVCGVGVSKWVCSTYRITWLTSDTFCTCALRIISLSFLFLTFALRIHMCCCCCFSSCICSCICRIVFLFFVCISFSIICVFFRFSFGRLKCGILKIVIVVYTTAAVIIFCLAGAVCVSVEWINGCITTCKYK